MTPSTRGTRGGDEKTKQGTWSGHSRGPVLTLTFDVTTATAVPVPDPEPVTLVSHQTTFLLHEMKQAKNLRERLLIHDELVLVYLDELREPA